MALLAQAQEADIEREVIYGEYGPVRRGELLHEWAAHDLMQPFIAGSGP